jgi:DNA-binding CsgD family transcriptional regulator
MKKVPGFRNYYEEYLDVCSSITSASVLIDIRKLVKKELPGSTINLPFGTCLIDYSTSEYKYLSDNCLDILSYTNTEYKKGGLDFNTLIFHPEDRIIFNEQVFGDIREYWNHIAPEEISEYRFSFNHRYFRKDGTVSQILQHSTYLEPQSPGLPVLNLLTFTDLGDFKMDTNIVLTISRLVKDQGYVKVFSKTYQQAVGESVLTKRELEILKLCHNGLSCKKIADKLFLSMQTVKNHKRNMMDKTSVRNITGLISLSIMNNWL